MVIGSGVTTGGTGFGHTTIMIVVQVIPCSLGISVLYKPRTITHLVSKCCPACGYAGCAAGYVLVGQMDVDYSVYTDYWQTCDNDYPYEYWDNSFCGNTCCVLLAPTALPTPHPSTVHPSPIPSVSPPPSSIPVPVPTHDQSWCRASSNSSWTNTVQDHTCTRILVLNDFKVSAELTRYDASLTMCLLTTITA